MKQITQRVDDNLLLTAFRSTDSAQSRTVHSLDYAELSRSGTTPAWPCSQVRTSRTSTRSPRGNDCTALCRYVFHVAEARAQIGGRAGQRDR